MREHNVTDKIRWFREKKKWKGLKKFQKCAKLSAGIY